MKNHNRKVKLIIFLSILVFLSNLYSKDIQCVWTGVERIVTVGDLHGDYENFVQILKDTKVIDDNLHWIAGKTHLVQIGDVMDRGNHAKKIFDLIMKLEKEAEAAGGKVHMLIGNHEEMNITGVALDRRDYVTAQQFIDFLPEDYREKQEKKFRKKMKGDSPGEAESNSSMDSGLFEFWQIFFNEAMREGSNIPKRKYLSGFNREYGKWILDHNAVIKINDIIFVHAGISPRFSERKIKDINDRLRIELEDYRLSRIYSQPTRIPERDQLIVYHTDGPLWYRDLAIKPEENFQETVDAILKNVEAKCIVCAHTPRRIRDLDHMKRFDGKVWIIDTNISNVYPTGNLSALIIEEYGKKFTLWLEERKGKSRSSEANKIYQETRLDAVGKYGGLPICVLVMIEKINLHKGG